MLLGTFMVLICLATATFFTSSVVLYEYCEVMEEVRTNATLFDSYSKSGLFNKDVLTNVRTCLHEDGDMSRPMQVYDEINGLYTFARDLNTLTKSGGVVSKSVEIPALIKEVTSILNYELTANSGTDRQNPMVSLKELKLYANSKATGSK